MQTTDKPQQQQKPQPKNPAQPPDDRERIAGIYEIYCKATKQRYIGLSTDVIARAYEHLFGDRQGKGLLSHNHENRNLQADWDRFPPRMFEFKLIEKCSPEQLADRELYWIAQRGDNNMAPSKQQAKEQCKPRLFAMAENRKLLNFAQIMPPEDPKKKRSVSPNMGRDLIVVLAIAGLCGFLGGKANLPKWQCAFGGFSATTLALYTGRK